MSKRRRVDDGDEDENCWNLSMEEVDLSPVPSLSPPSSIRNENVSSDTSVEEELIKKSLQSRRRVKAPTDLEGQCSDSLNASCLDLTSESFVQNDAVAEQGDNNDNELCLDDTSESILCHDKGTYHEINNPHTSFSDAERIDFGSDSNSNSEDSDPGVCLDDYEEDDDDEDLYLEEEEINVNIAQDCPVYEGAQISINDSMVAILSYVVRHELSGRQISDLLQLINFHCKKEKNILKSSLYLFKKYFSCLDCPVINHYYCSGCYHKLTMDNKVCPNAEQHPLISGISIFVEIPLIAQLKTLFQQEKFVSNLSYKNTRTKVSDQHLEDIYDGQIYKEVEATGFLSKDKPFNFSMIMNTDGVPVFKSSNTSLWPIFFNVNELPPHLRFKKEFTLIAGVWYGTKPFANLLLEPLLNTFKIIRKGFSVTLPNDKTETAKGIVISATTDLPAKVMICGMASHSGAFGCQVCKIPGGSVKITKLIKKKKELKEVDTKNKVWVYRYTEDLPLRNHSETIQFGERAQKLLQEKQDPHTNVNGVRFPSALFKIMYDGIKGFAIDDLHTLYLGVTKTLIRLLFDSTFSNYPFSIRNFLPLVDQRIKAVKLPNFLERGFRSIEKDSAYLKGTELETFAVYLLPVLEGIMPDKYLEHHAQLISCIHVLRSTSISAEDLLACENKLKKYVKDFEVLYGTRHMSMVIHLLQHLCFVVNNLGPMRYTSCFPYEGLNGEILKMIHGTKYVETQLASGCFLIKQFPKRLESLCSKEVKDFCDKMLHPSLRLKKLEDIDVDMFSVGTYHPLSAQKTFVYDTLQKVGISREGSQVQSFLRLKKSKLLFVSRSYLRTHTKNSFTCTFLSDNEAALKHGAIDLFVKVIVPKENIVRFFAIIQLAVVEAYVIGSTKVPHISRYSLSGDYVAIPLNKLRDMLVCVDVNDRSFVCKPIY